MTSDAWWLLGLVALFFVVGAATYYCGWNAGVEHERVVQADRDRMRRSMERAK